MAIRVETALSRFTTDCQMTLDWLGATEALWMSAPPTTDIRRNLKSPQMEALYESAYLRIFVSWEVFQEEITVRMMAGARTPSYTPQPAVNATLHPSLTAARTALYGSRDYLLWHNPDAVIKRVSKVLDSSPLENVLTQNKLTLDDFAQIRHKVAHGSEDAITKFKVAAQRMTGVAHNGSPGKLLRAQNMSDPLNLRRWVSVISTSLLGFANDCTK